MMTSNFATCLYRYKCLYNCLKWYGSYTENTPNYFVWMHRCEDGYYADFKSKSTNERPTYFTYYDETLFGIVRQVYKTLYSN